MFYRKVLFFLSMKTWYLSTVTTWAQSTCIRVRPGPRGLGKIAPVCPTSPRGTCEPFLDEKQNLHRKVEHFKKRFIRCAKFHFVCEYRSRHSFCLCPKTTFCRLSAFPIETLSSSRHLRGPRPPPTDVYPHHPETPLPSQTLPDTPAEVLSQLNDF